MKHFTKLIAASALLALSGFANATVISDNYNPTPVTINAASPLTFLHDFTDTGYIAGFDSITPLN